MGERAIIRHKDSKVAVYVHWDGEPKYALAYTIYARITGQRGDDGCYGMARLCQIIANANGFNDTQYNRENVPNMIGNLSVGLVAVGEMDVKWLDHGEYVFDNNWQIINREMGYVDLDLLCDIDKTQPFSVGKEYIVKWLESHDMTYIE